MADYVFCEDCGEGFYQRHGYEHLCLDCWKKRKRYEESGSWSTRGSANKDDALARLTKTLAEENQRLQAELAEWRALLPKLIVLSHPDRHGNSTCSTSVTQSLIAMRDRLRRGAI